MTRLDYLFEEDIEMQNAIEDMDGIADDSDELIIGVIEDRDKNKKVSLFDPDEEEEDEETKKDLEDLLNDKEEDITDEELDDLLDDEEF